MQDHDRRSHARMAVSEPGAALRMQAAETTRPGPGRVRVAVQATGVCFADIATAAARGRSTTFPVVPGHEIAGVVAEVGEGVRGWDPGDRVAIGWFGGGCGHCEACRGGDVVRCPERMIPGISYAGGWAQSVTVPADALAAIPAGMDPFDAAPMGCAGVTTFNAIRDAGLRSPATVAVFGMGGLGHLAVQFAARMGHRTIAIARGPEREALAHALGAHHYVDSAATAPGEALAGLGGADLILATASTTAPVAGLIPGLAAHGRLTLIGVDGGDVVLPAAELVMRGIVVTGHLTGSAADTQEAKRFAHVHGVRPIVERMALAEAIEAVARVAAGRARFRVVLDPSEAA